MFKIILKLVLIYTYVMQTVTKLEIRTKALQMRSKITNKLKFELDSTALINF